MGQTYTPTSPNPGGKTNRNYGNTQATTPHDITRCNVILPDPAIWPQPDDGYPYVIWFGLSGYNSDGLLNSIGDAQVPQQALLDAGVAIVPATLPLVRDVNGDTTEILATATTFDLTADPPQAGPVYRGNGVTPRVGKGPSSTPTPYPGQMPVGYATAFPSRPHPWVDPDWYSAWKCAEDIVRHCKYHSVQGTGQLPLNKNKDGAYGNSAGAAAILWLMNGDKSLVSEHIAWGGQEAESTRLKTFAIQNPNASMLQLKKEAGNGGPAAWLAAKRGASDGHDEACVDWDEDSDSVQLSLSATWYLSQHAAWPGMKSANDSFVGWCSHNSAMHADVLADANRYASNFGHVGTSTTGETQPHSIYSAYRMMKYLPLVRYVALDDSYLDPDAVSDGAVRQIDATIEDSETLWADMVETILSVIGPGAADPVVDEATYYCTVAEAAALVPQWPQASWPAELDATLELKGIDAAINMALSSKGIAIPFESDGTTSQEKFADWLTLICRNGVAWRVVRALFPDATGSGETPAWVEFKAVYTAGLKGIKDESMLPQFVQDSSSEVQPSTVNTASGGADVVDSLGSYAKPAFTRDMINRW